MQMGMTTLSLLLSKATSNPPRHLCPTNSVLPCWNGLSSVKKFGIKRVWPSWLLQPVFYDDSIHSLCCGQWIDSAMISWPHSSTVTKSCISQMVDWYGYFRSALKTGCQITCLGSDVAHKPCPCCVDRGNTPTSVLFWN